MFSLTHQKNKSRLPEIKRMDTDLVFSLTAAHEEKKQTENIIGLHILRDGTFIKIDNNNNVEFITINTNQFVKEMRKIPRFDSVDITVHSKYEALKPTRIVELTDHLLAIVYSFYGEQSFILAIDRQKMECIAGISINHNDKSNQYRYSEIDHVSRLTDTSLLVQFGNQFFPHEIILKKDKEYELHIAGAKNAFSYLEYGFYQQLSDQSGLIYVPVYKGAGIIYFLDNEFREIKKIVLGTRYDPSHVQMLPSYATYIRHFTLLSSDYFACIVERNDEAILSNYPDRNYLYFFEKDFMVVNAIKIEKTFYLDNLIALDEQHVAIIGHNEGKTAEGSPFTVKIFNLEGKLINQLELDENVFIATTRDGQIATCDKAGNIILHDVLLKKMIKKALFDVGMLKELAEITTGYLGFFSQSTLSPQNKYPEWTHPSPKLTKSSRCVIS